jgi:4-oxalocrotonate tautomerase
MPISIIIVAIADSSTSRRRGHRSAAGETIFRHLVTTDDVAATVTQCAARFRPRSRAPIRASKAPWCAASFEHAQPFQPKETTMPFAQIYMIEGRTDDQKRAVIEKVTAALVEAVNAPPETVRVWITEVPKTQWGIAGKTAKDLGR